MSTPLLIKRLEWWGYSLAACFCLYFLITHAFSSLFIVWHFTFYVQCLSMVLHMFLSPRFRFHPSRIFAFVNGLFIIAYYCIQVATNAEVLNALFMLYLMGLWQVQYIIVTGIELNEVKFDEETRAAI
ncbi:MAG TPA: hypothetical protein VD905_12190 [Flavobacteriales bacterium]|nr:hypothetical protein [Flavobacteriales bacterium]